MIVHDDVVMPGPAQADLGFYERQVLPRVLSVACGTQMAEPLRCRAPDEDDITDLRGVLYGLHAILRLHTAQEDETYLSLGDSTATCPLSFA